VPWHGGGAGGAGGAGCALATELAATSTMTLKAAAKLERIAAPRET